MTVSGDRPAQRLHVNDVAVNIDDGRYGSDRAGANDDVVARHDPGPVCRCIEERPGQPGVVDRVQVDDEVEVLHGSPFSVHGTGSVGSRARRFPAREARLSSAKASVTAGSERRHDVDLSGDEGLRTIEPKQSESLELIGGEVGNGIVVLCEVGREPIAVPVWPAAQEGLRLPPVGFRVRVVAADQNHRGAGGERPVSKSW